MRRLRLTNGETALVDNGDFDRLHKYTWIKHIQGYAYRWEWKNNVPKCILLQREVLAATKGQQVRFKDSNKLNAQTSNLVTVGKNILLVCPACGTTFYTWPTRIRTGVRACSRKCGYKIRKERFGVNNPAWKGGVTPLNAAIRSSGRMDRWRKAVFERDNYTCQHCGVRSGNGKRVTLHADHIKQFAYFPELRFELTNGRTLCFDCHKKTDTYQNNKLTYAK